MQDADVFLRLGASLAIGLLVGIERGWKARGAEDHGRAAGLRTFGLSGLMGGVSGILAQELGSPILAVVFLGFAAALGAFTWLEAKTTGMSAQRPCLQDFPHFSSVPWLLLETPRSRLLERSA